MNSVLAYICLAFLPVLLCHLSILVIAGVLELLIGDFWKRMPMPLLDLIAGFVAVWVGVGLFILLDQNLGLSVPVVIGLISTLYLVGRKQYGSAIASIL